MELGAPNSWIVRSGMIVFTAGCAALAPMLKPKARIALTTTAVASLGVTAFPCTEGCPGPETFTDTAHIVSAGLLYVALSATPVLQERTPYAVATTAIAGVALALHVTGLGPNGLSQRVGLTTNDLWLVVTALRLAATERNRELPDRNSR